mgnify:FL=1
MCAFERSEKGMKFNMDDKDFDVVNRYLNNDITLDEGIKEIKNSFSNL